MPNTTAAISRRKFAKLLGAGAACAVASPGMARAGSLFSGAESRSAAGITNTANVVRLSANENPYGPSPMAIKAMTDAFSLSCRYPDDHVDVLIESLAKINGVSRDQILIADGSGEILKLCAAAFTGPMSATANHPVELAARSRGGAMPAFVPGRGKVIVADPTFEAILNHARVNMAEVVKVPLNASFGHDVTKMLAAANEGLIYICNPNNPTASITSKNEMQELLVKAPRETIVLVDEAYHHYADSSDYESVIPLIKDHSNLIVARTFSKIFGMAGLRLGYCVAQPETIQRLRPHQTWDSVNIMAMVAAIASLNDPDHVTNGRRLNGETKKFALGELEAMGFKSIPSQANFMMIDVKRPVRPMLDGLRLRSVQVGRLFPALPNHMRVTIGKKPEMEAFLSAFRQVVGTV
ncbi:MAG TPA: aminotransferase class I/II-fold pyridoxal phosphate-dependent enzyme [Pyrinomonadaceae bacterium]|nr:aminotransferase class I/II-fold pyridoxal phosphate-dependent enzyme [Pyrinomonadaceae bacterium]